LCRFVIAIDIKEMLDPKPRTNIGGYAYNVITIYKEFRIELVFLLFVSGQKLAEIITP
jgi:hypothetical protein